MTEVSSEQISKIEKQLDRGLFLQAYEESQRIAPIAEWSGADACICAGRLAANLGGEKLSHILFRRTHRRYPQSLKAYTYELQRIHESYGPVAALRFLQTVPAPTNGSQLDRLHLLIAKSFLFARFRDFATAERFLRAAEKIDPHARSLLLQRSVLAMLADRYKPALTHCRELVHRHPEFVAGPAQYARLLLARNNHSGALAFLLENAGRFECYQLYILIVQILLELEEFGECASCLAEVTRLAPLKEKSLEKWVRDVEFRVAYCTGDLEKAAQIARTGHDRDAPEYLRILSSETSPKRIRLNVPYVRQHHDTCAPATLSALTGYWGRQISHDRIVESICYAGTPPHRIREWAAENGWFLSEFTLTWEAARRLVELKMPFAVEVAEPTGRHLHAVIGYDEISRTLLIRDPSVYFTLEVDADKYLKRYAGSGPRASVLAPAEKKDLLQQIKLPDARLYDLLFAIRKSLSGYDHRQALKLLKQLKTKHPYCHVTSDGLMAMAAYDRSTTSMRRALERHREIYPYDHTALFHLLACYGELGMVEARRSSLREQCNKDVHPVFFRERARDLIGREPETREACYWLRRAARAQPVDPECLKLYGDFLWARREFEQARLFYRLAVTVEDKFELYIPAYLAASRHVKKPDEVIELLKERVSRHGRKSSGPLMSLITAYVDMDQVDTGLEALRSGLRSTPGDGELLAFAAQTWAAYGRLDKARSCLAASKKAAERIRWYRTAAIVENYSGNKKESLKFWRAILNIDPANVEAHTFVSTLLHETKGPSAAVEHLAKACRHFPHHIELNRLWLSRLAEQDVAHMEEVALRLLEVHPAETWVHRALGMAVDRRGQHEAAERYLKEALRIEPHSPENQCALGVFYSARGKTEGARRAFQKSLALRVDTTDAIKGLFSLARSAEERIAAAEFVRARLVEQTTNGEGLVAFYEIAKSTVDPDAMLAILQEANRERPDLWRTWSTLAAHCIAMDALDEAEACAKQGCDRFPLLSSMWMCRAEVHLLQGEVEKERKAVETAHELMPQWPVPSQRLCVLYVLDGQLEKAALLIRNACAHAPLDLVNHGMYAHMLHLQNRDKEACRELTRALYLDPSYDWAWNLLQSLCIQQGNEERPAVLIRNLLRERPNEPLLELRLVEHWLVREYYDYAESALRKLIRKAPQFAPAYDLLARIHGWKGEPDKAIEVCTPEGFDPVPLLLQVRRASILVEKNDYKAAAGVIEPVLEHNPESLACWQLLLESLWNMGSYETLAERAKRASFLFPFDETLRGRLGDAYLKLGNPEPARRAFARAFALDRGHLHAGLMLFDLELQREEVETAERVLSLLEMHGEPQHADVVLRKIRLALKKNDDATAGPLFRKLCLTDLGDTQSLEETISAIEQAGWQEKMCSWLSAIIQDERINPCAAERWAELCTPGKVDAWLPKLPKLPRNNILSRTGAEVVRRVTDGVCEALGRSIRQRSADAFLEHKRSLSALFQRYCITLALYPGTWSRTLQGMLFCGFIGEAYRKVGTASNLTSVTPHLVSAVVSTCYLCGRRDRAVDALEELKHRASNSEVTKQQRQANEETFELFERLLTRGYGKASDDLFPQDDSDLSVEFLRHCVRFLAALHADPRRGRDREGEIMDELLAACPGSWYMEPVLRFIVKQYRHKRYR